MEARRVDRGPVSRSPGATARGIALDVLHRVESGGAFANILLLRSIEDAGLSAADAALATELTLGTLRWRGRLDHTIAARLRSPLSKLPSRIRQILRLGAYQLLFLDRIPARSAVHESVTLAKQVGHAGTAALVNAVLRRIADAREAPPPADPLDAIAVAESHPRWLLERWIARWGEIETRALCRANNTPAPVTVRINPLRLPDGVDAGEAPAYIERRLEAEGITVERGAFPDSRRLRGGALPDRLAFVERGWLHAQDEGSMAVAYAVGAEPGETIVDACAAPGGKTTHLAALVGDRGRLIAVDPSPEKTRRIAALADRMGARAVEVLSADAAALPDDLLGRADRVLVDAPCTGLGVIRRRPEIRWRVASNGPARAAAAQRTLIAGAARALRPGGRLTYGVCSTEPEEGPEIVQWFLRESGFLPDPFEIPWRGGVLAAPHGTLLLLPHRHDTDGFFVARMRCPP